MTQSGISEFNPFSNLSGNLAFETCSVKVGFASSLYRALVLSALFGVLRGQFTENKTQFALLYSFV
ncbi:hypothetical protein [Polaromonas sp. CG_23.6]|uniref:hypothetical protein n=1 Tax=Polaromonas sp. CG_23.6 TaxID=2760709 RepID=UPI002473DA01|nr:hypothetical protein [Polaromonas sp. CG_23.6]MDH6185342.1 hypothetical protein [Polaromonas sp. CG_23.6]